MNHFQNINSPIVVGGVGGSGTRVIAQMLIEAGVYMGDMLNEPKDNLWFTLLFRRPKWLSTASETKQLEFLEMFHKKMMNEKISFSEKFKVRTAEFEFIIEKYIRNKDWFSLPVKISKSIRSKGDFSDNKYWGWKEPNTHLYIQILAKKYPEMKYLFIMRNGLDMAFSDNKVQLRNFGNHFGIKGNSTADSLEFWIRANSKAIESGKEILGERFKILQMEKLCMNPKQETEIFLKWAGINYNDSLLEKISSIPKLPSSTNRYKEFDLSVFSKEQLHALKQLGYNQ